MAVHKAAVLRQPSCLILKLIPEIDMDFISKELQDYAEAYTSAESELLADINRKTHLEVLYPRMLSGHLQGRILAMFSRMQKPRRILEVGTYTGYSAICLAEGLQPGGELITLEKDPELEDRVLEAVAAAGLSDQIKMIVGPASESIDQLQGPFDLVFIDADKANYSHYYEQILPKMAEGGILIADNVLWSGRVLDPDDNDKETKGLKDFVQHVAADDRVSQVLMPVRDGLLIVIKNPVQ